MRAMQCATDSHARCTLEPPPPILQNLEAAYYTHILRAESDFLNGFRV